MRKGWGECMILSEREMMRAMLSMRIGELKKVYKHISNLKDNSRCDFDCDAYIAFLFWIYLCACARVHIHTRHTFHTSNITTVLSKLAAKSL